MKVRIIKPFSVDTPKGDVHYAPGQIVEDGRQAWIDSDLAVRVKDELKAAPKSKSAG